MQVDCSSRYLFSFLTLSHILPYALLRSMLRNMNIMKKYTRKVTRVGKRSLSIVLPAEIVEELKIFNIDLIFIT